VKLEQSFDVAAPIDRVWQALIDVEQVAPCLPGAAVTGRNDDGTYNGTFTVKIGPTTASYSGKLEMREVDEEAHQATLHAQGTDKRGQGGANATIVSKVTDTGEGSTRVEVDTDYHITGRLARFGRGGMIEDISERLLKEFAGRLQSSLAGGPEPGAEDGVPAAVEAEPEAMPPSAEEAAEEAAPPPTDVAGGEEPAVPSAPAPAAPEDAAPPPPPEAVEPPPPDAGPTPGAGPGPGAGPPPAAGPGAGPPPPPPSEPLDASGLVGEVLLERIRANPWPLVGVGALFVLLIRTRRRRRRAFGFEL